VMVHLRFESSRSDSTRHFEVDAGIPGSDSRSDQTSPNSRRVALSFVGYQCDLVCAASLQTQPHSRVWCVCVGVGVLVL
jgi:hypothetical protein